MKILLIEDDKAYAALLRSQLEQAFGGRLSLRAEATLAGGCAACGGEKPDAILLDLNLADSSGLGSLRKALAACPGVPVVVMTALADDKLALEAVQGGAQDYLVKGACGPDALGRVLRYAAERAALRRREKEVSERLRESEDRFRDLFDKAPLGYQSLDADGKFLEVNQAWLDTLGYAREEVVGRWFGDFVAPGQRGAFRERFPLFKERGAVHTEFEMLHKDGSRRFITFDGRVGRKPDGSFKQTHCILKDVTQERALEADYRQLFESMVDGCALHEMILDAEGRPSDYRFLKVNAAFEEMTGLKAADITGRRLSEIMPGEYSRWVDIYAPVVLTGRPLRFSSGSAELGRYYDISAYRPRPGQFVAVFTDITMQRRAEADKDLLSRTIRASLNEIYIFDDETLRFRFANDGALRNIGYTAGEMGALTPLDLKPDLSPAAFAAITGPLKDHSGTVRVFETRHRRKNGSLYAVEVHLQHVPSSRAFLAVINDITARKASEANMARLQAAIEQSSEAVVVTDAQGVIEYVNPAFERISGYSRAEALGQKPSVLKSGLQDDAYYSELWETITAGRAWNGRFVNRRKDGSLYTEETAISPVKDGGGRIVNFVAVKRDISERERLAADLLKAQKMESLGVIAGGIAHDFNNMLTGITANLSLLAARGGDSDGLAADALSAARSAQALTARLLSFSRGGQPVKKTVSLEAALRDIFDISTRGARARVELEVQDGLWAVNCDETQIKQLVANLLINALQAMPSGGTLRLAAANAEEAAPPAPGLEPGRFVRIAVSDTGVGIPEKYLDRVFDPYFTTKEKGHGLGLAMAWTVIRAHGGHIAAASEPGRGSTFTLYLPAAAGCSPAQAAPAGERAVRKGSGRILVMDDEELLRRAAGRLLAELGYSCETAPDGKAAAELYAAAQAAGRPFAAAILDLVVPGGMGGAEAAAEIRRLHPAAVLVASSGYSDDALMSRYRENGFDAALPKPYRYEDLAEVLDGLLRKEEGSHA